MNVQIPPNMDLNTNVFPNTLLYRILLQIFVNPITLLCRVWWMFKSHRTWMWTRMFSLIHSFAEYSFRYLLIPLHSFAEYDECSNSLEHGCEHECFNTLGGYSCQCRIGYELHSDEKRCESKQCTVHTPPRRSEISMKNWRAKMKPVLIPHL
jgi:hypothetical protein